MEDDRVLRVVQLLASPFFGGPERQMLGVARHLPGHVASVFLSFAERGLAKPFIDEVRRAGFAGDLLVHNVPHLRASVTEIAGLLRAHRADVLCCSGYKPDLLGWLAARRAGVPVVCVSHGWTAATWKVRGYEALDRWVHGRMDAVICVSEGQADKVRGAGVAAGRITVIPNAIGREAFVARDPAARRDIEGWFSAAPRWLVGTAGRFSPEKGLGVLIDAAAAVAARRQDVGFVLFGDGPLRPSLEAAVAARGLRGSVVMPGFRQDLSRFLPALDLAVMSSFTEGLPIFLLEASAAGVPAAATAVGGVPEVILDGATGCLVRPGDAQALAGRILDLLADPVRMAAMGEAARARVRREFSAEAAGLRYAGLFARVASAAAPRARRPTASPAG